MLRVSSTATEVVMSSPIDLSKPNRTIHVGVILMNSETELLDVAPVDLLSGLSKDFSKDWDENILPPELKSQALDVQIHWVNETGKMAKLTGGINLCPTDDFVSCPKLDIVVMGAHEMMYKPNATELDFVRKAYVDSSAFITICGGFQAVFQAGLFKGKTVTAPRVMVPMLRQMAPDTEWVEERWHRDGKLWTSGALLNGLDLMRNFVTDTWGGDGTLAEYVINIGHWPVRDLVYGDVSHRL